MTTKKLSPTKPTRGLLVVYTGDGKGKTTAAFGMAMRAMGWKMPVAIVQFIKGKWKTGEMLFAETLPQLDFSVMGRGFTWESEDLALDKKAAMEAWKKAKNLITAGKHTLVILDELTYVIQYGFVPLEEVLETFKSRPTKVSVVVTGRKAPEALIALADLVTEMTPVKHPFEQGIPAQQGVDF